MAGAINALEETLAARRMLAEGATRGMVDQYLQRCGLNEFTRAEVMRDATRSLNTLARVKSVLLSIAGLMIIGTGIRLHFEGPAIRLPGPEVYTTVAFVGLLVTILGLYGVFHRRY